MPSGTELNRNHLNRVNRSHVDGNLPPARGRSRHSAQSQSRRWQSPTCERPISSLSSIAITSMAISHLREADLDAIDDRLVD